MPDQIDASISATSSVTATPTTRSASAPRTKQLLLGLLPRGKAWTRNVSSKVYDLLCGVAEEFGRVHDRAQHLLADEMDPRRATETLADWERITGLPDPCHPNPPTTLQGRRDLVTARWVSRGGWTGGPSVPFLQSLASELGYTLTVRRFQWLPYTCESACNSYLYDGEWLFLWELNAEHQDDDADARLKCQIERYALGALSLAYTFPIFSFDDMTFDRESTAVLEHPFKLDQDALAVDIPGTLYIPD